ncbi:hypothetical protein BJF78_00635 [Pseudonocardia sp. CNS-139]|nr:hypothetical protein BJF78_00635 [Pseudonocardia sp. CNS-139]
MTWLQYALLGIGMGSAYVLLAQGIVLIYRASGVVNFAHGGLAMLAAYLYNVEFRAGLGWAVLPSLLAAVGLVTAFSALIHPLVMRPLRASSPLTRVIATLGILMVVQSAASLRWGTASVATATVLPGSTVTLPGGIVLSTDRIWLLAIAVMITVGLHAYSRHTVSGIATRAAAENQRGTSALGWSPDALATVNWAAGGALAAVAGILITPYAGLNITNLTLVVIAALAAALIGQFGSFWLVLAGGMLIGVLRSLLVGPLAEVIPFRGAEEAIPFLIILGYMVVRGRGIPARSSVSERLPSIGTGRIRLEIVLPVLAAALLLVLLAFDDEWNIAFGVMVIAAVIMLSVVVLTGYTGQLSLAQYALAGLGGLFGARLAMGAWEWPFWSALVVGTVTASLCGVVLALPALRTRGVNLAVITLGLGLAIQSVIFTNDTFAGGVQGVAVEPPSVFGISLDPILYPARYTAFSIVVLAVVSIAVANLRRGPAGRRLIAVRTSERTAASLGIHVVRAKIFAFAISAGIAGLGGTLLALQNPVVLFGVGYEPMDSIEAVALAVVGGTGWVMGPLMGAGLHPGGPGRVITDYFTAIDGWIPLIGGVVLLVILVTHPDGQASVTAKSFTRLLRLDRWGTGGVRAAVPPSDVAGAVSAVSAVRPLPLVLDGITVRYGGVVALDEVSLRVEPGQVVGLMGPNGAGKTTLIDAVSGFAKVSGGRIRIGDVDVTSLPAHRRAALGMARSFQSLELLEDVTIRENLMAAADTAGDLSYLTDLVRPARPPFSAAASAAVREFDLADVLDKRPGEIPYGKRRLVAMARAVAANPSVLLLDEPGAGLDDNESAELGRLVRRLADTWGMAILLIEHDVRTLMDTCDRITVIDFGRPISEGTPDDVAADPAVVAAYLGEPPAGTAPREAPARTAELSGAP